MKYQVGDKVVLRKDLVIGQQYGSCRWRETTKELLELPYLTIKDAGEFDVYSLEGTERIISKEMISHKYKEKGDNMKYQKGDKVVIRKELKVGEWYGNIQWWDNDEPLKEKDFIVIDAVDEDGDYVINGGRYINDEMISHKYKESERIMKYKEGDKVVLKKNLVDGEMYGGCYWTTWMKPTTGQEYVTIKEVTDKYYRVEESIYAYTDEMISHKYEEEPKYIWYFEERGETYFLTKKALIKASSRKHLRKVLDGEVDGTLLTEEDAKQSIFYHFGMLNKHTPPPKEQLYYVCIPGSTGNFYMNYLISEDVYYAGIIIEDNYHRTKFTEEEADKIIGTSTVLYKKEVE